MEQTVERAQPQHISGIALLEFVTLALGIWLIASTYALQIVPWAHAREINGIFGAIFLGMAITRLAMSGPRWWWLHAITLACAIFVIIAPFLFGYAGDTKAMLNSVIVGALVALVEIVGLVTGRREP